MSENQTPSVTPEQNKSKTDPIVTQPAQTPGHVAPQSTPEKKS